MLSSCFSYDSEIGSDAPLSSVVYKWNPETSSFIQPYSVDVSHAYDVQHHQVDDKCFLVFTMDAKRIENANTNKQSMKIFQVHAILNSITFFQFFSYLHG